MINHESKRNAFSSSEPVQTNAERPPVIAPHTFTAKDNENPIAK
jgi:hypothetical protein